VIGLCTQKYSKTIDNFFIVLRVRAMLTTDCVSEITRHMEILCVFGIYM